MKRLFAILALFSATILLTACAAKEGDGRTEALQRQYAAMGGCTADVCVSVVREDATERYTLALSRTAGETRMTVTEPEALAGISAVVGDDAALSLEFNGMVLDAGSADPRVSAANAADIVLRAVAEGWVTERSTERYGDVNALRLCFETEHAGEKLLVAVWFDDDNRPLYAEIEHQGEILAYLEFTDFRFGDIIP